MSEGKGARVLVVEDDEIARVALEEQLRDAGHTVTALETAEAALTAVERDLFEVAVTDVRLPGMDGITFLEKAKDISPEIVVIVLTGYGAVEDAVRAMKAGAADYLCKPVTADEVGLRIDRALALRRAETDRDRLQREVEKMYSFGGVIGQSDRMQEIFSLAEMVKDIDSTVLIEGETGTGKDLLARAIHFASKRRRDPFIAVNCMVLSRSILESELFGHEKGAFTGAYRSQPGRFEVAGRGTVYLDDVDDIPLDLQGKLVNVLENRKCERVGSTREIDLSCRVICATKGDLSELATQGTFREDLYYRMNVVNIRIPPLRERKDDIAGLVEHFLDVYRTRHERAIEGITPEAMQALYAYDWPGNVRELEHVVERAVALCPGHEITARDLPATVLGEAEAAAVYSLNLPPTGAVDLPKLLSDVEAEVIRWATALSGGRQSGAAKLLGIPRTTLQAKLHKHEHP
ncbi:MAG: sigma-54-dependent transcriptional regulator [Planctomycetota bacterium]|jgi:DNA-binding NtrC family response regulator